MSPHVTKCHSKYRGNYNVYRLIVLIATLMSNTLCLAQFLQQIAVGQTIVPNLAANIILFSLTKEITIGYDV